jgi:hypothetical protein
MGPFVWQVMYDNGKHIDVIATGIVSAAQMGQRFRPKRSVISVVRVGDHKRKE